ncbi:MAG: CoA-binding protein [Candidatus Delongbacteria bacterium]|nr:CoA-binding protein [Candidatus Cloacimonadota bacterium]MCA9788058.1 CoA-binding protein [Candidatus Cloacimonadota bacterium]MCB9475121.1 CoA-binding protein [Candidatus Delongbacteria bacterium]
MPDQGLTVVVLGASDKPERYSNRAVRMLLEHGHVVIPVHPSLQTVEGLTVVPSLARVPRPVDTLTVYVSPTIGATLEGPILALAPRRVIFNPGSEAPSLVPALEAAGIEVVQNCTLVMLGLGSFA